MHRLFQHMQGFVYGTQPQEQRWMQLQKKSHAEEHACVVC